MDWTAIFTLLTAVGSLGAACCAYKSVKEQEEMRRAENRPLLVVKNIKLKRNGTDKAIYVYFKNSGKGLAKLRVIDVNDNKIEAHIGTPISVAPSGTSHIKIFLEDDTIDSDEKEFKISLYYWSADKTGYRTEVHFFVGPCLTESTVNTPWRMPSENIESIENIKIIKVTKKTQIVRIIGEAKQMPSEVMQWPRGELFMKPWW